MLFGPKTMPSRLATALAVAWLLTSGPAGAETLDNALAYTTCMQLARKAPAQAFEEALAWQDDDGGRAARHCAAVALIGLGQPAEAARRLEDLARAFPPAETGPASEILAQAGQAWLTAGEPGRALTAQSAALELAPENAELLINRAITLAARGSYRAAIDDLDRAAVLVPQRAEVLVLRASAYRRVDEAARAEADLARALTLEPDNPDGLLERGILRLGAGDQAGARQDWLQTVTLAPDSPAADAARARLEQLDVTVE